MGLIIHPNSYLRSVWNIIDLFVVISAIFNIYVMTTNISDKGTIKALRVIRVLRPLKTVQRIRRLKDVFDTIVQSIRNVFDIMIVYILFQFIFAVIAVQLFSGRFYYCNDISKLTFDKCRGYFIDYSDTAAVVKPRQWRNFCFHFDNILYSMVTLFTVTTSEGWLLVLRHSMDSSSIGTGPIYNFRSEMAIFYIVFFIVFPFFFINIFIALIIITFQEEGEKLFAGLNLDKNQKLCIDFVVASKPRSKYIPSKRNSIQYKVWKIVFSRTFVQFILILIALNTLVLMMGYYQHDSDISTNNVQSSINSMAKYKNYNDALKYLNLAFIILFSFECILKMAALNPKNYFKDLWNCFDFITTIASINDVMITNIRTYQKGSIRRVLNIGFLRLFRAARLVKLLRQISGIRIILWTFVQSFKSLPYVLLLIFMLFFIYCVIGMQLFGDIALDADTPIHIYNNFQDFSHGMLLLFRCATGENWQEIMLACEEGKKCQCYSLNCIPRNDCGNDIAYPYFILFSFATTYIMFNLFIAVLMENFDYLTRDWSILGPHHLDEFVEKWSNIDFMATGEILYSEVYDLLINMEPPLGFGKNCPYRLAYRKLIRMNMPVTQGKVNFTTTLMALIREVLGIKPKNPNDVDIHDMELRLSISKLWPHISREKVYLMVPSEETLRYPNLTIGKIYTCMRIHENWRAFQRGSKGRRQHVQAIPPKSRVAKLNTVIKSNRSDINECPNQVKCRGVRESKVGFVDQDKSVGEQISNQMYQKLTNYLDKEVEKVPRPANNASIGINESIEAPHNPWNRKSTPSLHFSTIVQELSRIFNLNYENQSLSK